MTAASYTALNPMDLLIEGFMHISRAPTADLSVKALLRSNFVRTPPTQASAPVRTFQGTEFEPLTAAGADMAAGLSADRPTTTREETIGEIRAWALLPANWDGEGATQPDARSLAEAVSFMSCLSKDQRMPEPMLHSSGRSGLYWREGDLYGDLEFTGEGNVVYFVKHAGERHKGVTSFDGKKMPPVFSAILRA